MSVVSVGFLFLIVLVSGGIAVLADWLGRKLGKKKLTYQTRWFRLRPKKTAQIATFLSGFLVSLLTILLVSIGSSDVRQWIAEGPAAVDALRRTLGELDQARKTKDAVDSQLFASREQLEKSQETTRRQQLEVRRLVNQAEKLRKEAQGYQARLDKAQRQFVQVQRRFHEVQGKLNESQRLLSTARNQLAEASEDVREAEKQVVIAQQNLKTEKENLASAKRDAKTAVDQYNDMSRRALDLDIQVSALEQDTRRLEDQRSQVQAELDVRRVQLNQAQNEVVNASIALEKLNADLRQSQLAVVRAGSAVAISRFQPMMFSLGEEIARQPLAPNLTKEEALEAVRSLVRAAQAMAIEKGAEAKGPFPAAGIFEREDPNTRRVYSPDELEAQLAENLAGRPDGLLLIAVSTLNAFKGEPVSLEVAVAENPVVYRESQVVAEIQVDGRKPDSEVLDKITDFVSNQVKEQARQDRMIPKRGSESTFGSIPMSELYNLVNRVRATGRAVRLQAIAEAETRAGDQLRLDFRVR